MEAAQAFQWVTSTAHADGALMAVATGGVWQGYADIGVTAPYVLFTQQSGLDVLTMNARRLFVRLLVQIKMIGPTANYAAIVTGADRLDALFKSVGPTALPSGGVLACYREQLVVYDEIPNGVAWSHLGGLYHIDLQAV